MKDFFKVTELDRVLELVPRFPGTGTEIVGLDQALGRILAADVRAEEDIPEFPRATMDGYAVRGSSTFGASEGNPAYLTVKGKIPMGTAPDFSLGPGEAARISTGGMLPDGADAVVMIEHTEALDDQTIEVYRSVAPGVHMVQAGEDLRAGETLLGVGRELRPQDVGLLAAMGRTRVTVRRRPVVAVISTGDEVVAVDRTPGPGQIRDINSHTLSGMVAAAGGVPLRTGIVADDGDALLAACKEGLGRADMVLISGGSSVGTRDFTIDAFSALPGAEILFHGISISPGKPTILAQAGNTAFWGLPGHVVSAMVVLQVVVLPFLHHIAGRGADPGITLPARMRRNIASAQGRVDFVRVKLTQEAGERWADPILGKSGLIHTMVRADGLVKVDLNTEGLDRGDRVEVIPV